MTIEPLNPLFHLKFDPKVFFNILLYTASALYDLVKPQGKTLKPVEEFNSTRILLHGQHGEHWLNGTKVLEYDGYSLSVDGSPN